MIVIVRQDVDGHFQIGTTPNHVEYSTIMPANTTALRRNQLAINYWLPVE